MIQDFINQLEKKEDLDFHSMQSAIESIMTGEVDDLSLIHISEPTRPY